MASGKQNAEWHDVFPPNGEVPERLLVHRILSSQCFERSARMRDFLAYVCDRALSDPEAEIREQDIGCAVFGRRPDYDTNQDNIVRVNASQLRKKLELYFVAEGSAERVILELPKGHYKPLFHLRSEIPNLPEAPPEGAGQGRKVRLLAYLSAALALVCLGLLVAWLAGSRKTAPGPAGELHALWSRLIRKGEPTAVVLSDSSLGLLQDLTGRPVPLSEYIHPDIWRQAPSLDPRPDAQLAARLSARRRHTDMASVNAARRILGLAGADQGAVSLFFARDFTLRQMKSGNVILLGSKRTNPWVEIVENRMHFRFGFNLATRQAYFENRQPSAGELPAYANDPATSYCQITFLPNPSGTGNILVISGTDVEGTEAGAEFLTSAAGVGLLRKRLPAEPAGQFPYFEALLKSARIGGSTPGCEIAVVRDVKSTRSH